MHVPNFVCFSVKRYHVIRVLFIYKLDFQLKQKQPNLLCTFFLKRKKPCLKTCNVYGYWEPHSDI